MHNFTARDDAVALPDAGEVDVAISVPPTTAKGRILTRPLFNERFVCIVRKGHPRVGATLYMPTVLSLSHLLVSPEGDRFGLVDQALASLGTKRRLALTIPHMYAAPLLIARSDMIAIVMEGVVAESGHADEINVFDPPLALNPARLVLSWHRGNDAHPAQR